MDYAKIPSFEKCAMMSKTFAAWANVLYSYRTENTTVCAVMHKASLA
jgi:hypothetical protein